MTREQLFAMEEFKGRYRDFFIELKRREVVVEDGNPSIWEYYEARRKMPSKMWKTLGKIFMEQPELWFKAVKLETTLLSGTVREMLDVWYHQGNRLMVVEYVKIMPVD